MRDIEILRKEIDEIDEKLVSLLEERMSVVKEVASYKKKNNVALKDIKREEALIEKNVQLLKNKEYAPFIEALYKDMMSYSRHYQKQLIPKNSVSKWFGFDNKSVAFQGISGSFSHEALNKFFTNPKTINKDSFEDVFISVLSDECDFGIVPIENSSTGGIHDVYDLLKKHDLYIVACYDLKIQHNLIGYTASGLDDIKHVYSHEQGFKQSKQFLDKHTYSQIPYYNTAMSVKHVKDLGDINCAAIGNKKAAEIYGLEILAANIEDDVYNTTRFIVISKSEIINTEANKISLIVTLPHEVGALSRILSEISNAGKNMLKIESRPIPEHPWSYTFYIDLEGNVKENEMQELVEKIKSYATEYYYLGNYICRKD